MRAAILGGKGCAFFHIVAPVPGAGYNPPLYYQEDS